MYEKLIQYHTVEPRRHQILQERSTWKTNN